MKQAHLRLGLEELERRDLLSASVCPVSPLVSLPTSNVVSSGALLDPAQQMMAYEMHTIILHPETWATLMGGAVPAASVSSPNPAWLTPAQVRHAYGFDQVPLFELNGTTPDAATYNATAGKGQTIAIVDGGDDPNILQDANVFSQQFGLPLFNSGGPTFTKLNEHGVQGSYPALNASWSQEISLDVEWAHAIAPQANIVLVEATYDPKLGYVPLQDMENAINTARNYPGVSTVSMSWGYWDGSSYMQKAMPGLDSAYLTTPAGHTPITFVAATLDNGSSPYEHNVYWPSVSPNVLAVGGTTLTLNSAGSYGSESAWKYSTGGLSAYEAEPSWQKAALSSTRDPHSYRGVPDVAYVATGLAMYDSVPYNGASGWLNAYGDSVGTPQWAALIALADQERGTSLDGATQVLPTLYQLATASPGVYLHDITTGSNGAYNAVPGYDLVTGLGTPIANQLIPALARS